MSNRRQYDLAILGDEPSGLAAAACAARAGASCVLIRTGVELTGLASVSAVPNFVWRKLDLHETDFSAEPVSAHVSLFRGGKTLATYEDNRHTEEALSKNHPHDASLWSDFRAEMRRKAALPDKPGQDVLSEQPDLFGVMALDGTLTDSMAALLEDYFENDAVKTHLASIAGLAFGVGGEEPGSAAALAAAADEAAWRVKNPGKLQATLTALCEKAGVDFIAAPLRRIEGRDGRSVMLEFEDDDGLRAKALMAASPRIASALGLGVRGAPAPLFAQETAQALVSVKLSESPQPPEHIKDGDKAVYYIAETADELRAARDAVLEGRTPDNPPVVFEFGDREIIVRAPYCPRMLNTEDGPREWTGQDRQYLGKQVVERLSQYLNGALPGVQRTEVTLYGAADADPEHPLNDDTPDIAAPLPQMDEIGAAVTLALGLIDRE